MNLQQMRRRHLVTYRGWIMKIVARRRVAGMFRMFYTMPNRYVHLTVEGLEIRDYE